MKTIGILGGMSCESTLEYYRIINQEVKKRLGNQFSGKIIINSFNFEEIEILQQQNNWIKLADMLSSAAAGLKKAGAESILIATNTMHKVAPQVQDNVSMPLLHIADATAEALKKDNISKVLLLGTKFTMEEDFYKDKIEKEHNLSVLLPDEDDRNLLHKIIFNELCRGIITDEAEKAIQKMIDDSKDKGAQGVILGCTELPNIIKEASLPIYDTAKIHSVKAVEWALS